MLGVSWTCSRIAIQDDVTTCIQLREESSNGFQGLSPEQKGRPGGGYEAPMIERRNNMELENYDDYDDWLMYAGEKGQDLR